jgi:hypothetical protein
MTERERKHQDWILWLALAGVVIVLIVAFAASITSVVIATEVRNNAAAIGRNSEKLSEVERADRRALRMASYRTCERGQRERAEQQFRAGLTTPAVTLRLVKQLGLPRRLIGQTSIQAVRKRLPIFDCIPILTGGQAVALDPKQQREYVRRFAAGQLNASP